MFDDFAQLDRAAVFHRLPNGVGGFVEEDFVGHGGKTRRVPDSNDSPGRGGIVRDCRAAYRPLAIVGYQFTIQVPKGRLSLEA